MKADSLLQEGRYQLAAIEYERVVFSGVDNTTRTLAFLRKSACYVNLGELEKAMNCTERIQYFGLNDSMQYEARYHAAFNSYLNEKFEQSQAHLLQIELFLPREYHVQSALLFALTLNELRKWSEAEEKVRLYIDSTQIEKESLNALTTELYEVKKHPKFKKPQTAFVLSSIFPGSGQLYSGHLLDALLSTTLVLTGVGIAAYGVLVAKYYVSGIVVGYGFFQRFYIAGQKRARYLAERRNYRKKKKYNQQLEDFILSLK